MENDVSALDSDSVAYYESFNTQLKRSRSSIKKPNPARLVNVVRDILLSAKPHFRYQINGICKEAVKNKFNDPSGDSSVQKMQKYLQ